MHTNNVKRCFHRHIFGTAFRKQTLDLEFRAAYFIFYNIYHHFITVTVTTSFFIVAFIMFMTFGSIILNWTTVLKLVCTFCIDCVLYLISSIYVLLLSWVCPTKVLRQSCDCRMINILPSNIYFFSQTILPLTRLSHTCPSTVSWQI